MELADARTDRHGLVEIFVIFLWLHLLELGGTLENLLLQSNEGGVDNEILLGSILQVFAHLAEALFSRSGAGHIKIWKRYLKLRN